MKNNNKTDKQLLAKIVKLNDQIAELKKSAIKIDKTQGDLKENDNRYRSILDNSLEGIGLINHEQTFTYANKNLAVLFGYPLKEVIGANFKKFVAPESLEIVIDRYTRRQNGEKITPRYEVVLLTKNGERTYAELSSSVVELKGRKPQTIVQFIDNTEHKKAEEKLKFLSKITFQASTSIITTDLNFNITWVNNAFRKLYGYENDEVIGKRPDILNVEPFADEMQKEIYKTVAAGNIFKGEALNIKKDGSVFQSEFEIFPMLDENGHIIAYSCHQTDISNRKQIQKEIELKSKELEVHLKNSEKQRVATISVLSDLNATTKRLQSEIAERIKTEEELKIYRDHLEELVKKRTISLEEANRELEAFAYSVSHDLRAPLRAIDGFTRILIEDYASKLDKEGKRVGSVIQYNAKKMGKLIDDLLTFSRLGRASMSYSKIDMKNMVNAIYHEVTNAKERKRIKFTIGDLPSINGDTNMMRQVWMNLISNAVKFSSKRKQAIIDISSKEVQKKITYSVTDNGAGFDMKYVDKLFGVFNRLHSEKDFEGTGVGLALARRIIIRHGGNIWADSKLDNGAKFYFTLAKKGSSATAK